MRVSRSTIGPAPSFTPRFIVLARATVIGVVMNRMMVCIGRIPITEQTPTNASGRMTSMLNMNDVQRFGASMSLAFLARRMPAEIRQTGPAAQNMSHANVPVAAYATAIAGATEIATSPRRYPIQRNLQLRSLESPSPRRYAHIIVARSAPAAYNQLMAAPFQNRYAQAATTGIADAGSAQSLNAATLCCFVALRLFISFSLRRTKIVKYI